jgi:hypothetical protein
MPDSLSRALDRAVARENADPQGLSADVVADMEADVLENPDKYPHLHKLLTDPPARTEFTPATDYTPVNDGVGDEDVPF